MNSVEKLAEKDSHASIEENETQLNSPSDGVDLEEPVPHIHAKTLVLVFVSEQPL